MNGNRKALNYFACIGSSGLFSLAIAIPQQGEAQAVINWSMAERTVRIENREFMDELYNGERHWMIEGPGGEPGLYGGVSSVPLDQINPSDGYQVTLDACESTLPAGGACDVDQDGDVDRTDVMAIYSQSGTSVTPGDLGDIDGNGVINIYDARQCNMQRVSGGGSYQWRVDGELVASNPSRCQTVVSLSEGPHDVELELASQGETYNAAETITVKDYLIVIMGDSYSSGEGNATRYDDVEDDSFEDTLLNNGAGWSEGGFWDYANCHRSGRSGQANAAIDLERADPHSSVTTLFLACSGAQIDSGINGIKDGYNGGAEKPQTYLAYELTTLNGRVADIVLMGIGGNDVGFVPIVAEGVLQPDVFLSTEALPLPLPVPPLLPFDGSPVPEIQIANLLLAPDAAYTDPQPAIPPGPPLRVLQPEALHACEAQYQKAVFGEGDLGPEPGQSPICREGIGASEFGLADVHRCLTGNGADDCVFARSYYDSSSMTWRYPDAASSGLGIPEQWPGLGVASDAVFYTEYPDLTTRFIDDDPTMPVEYCDIGLTKSQVLSILRILKLGSDNPDLIQSLIDYVKDNVDDEAVFGLAQNEFKWASEVVLNGPDTPEDKLLSFTLTSSWRVKTGPVSFATLVGGDTVNLGDDAPALNEMTALSNSAYGWTSVIGTHDLASGHGLCTPQPTGDPIGDLTAAYAYLLGPNASGSAHPNLLGAQAYREPIADALCSALLGGSCSP